MLPKLLIIQCGPVTEPVLSRFGDAQSHFLTPARSTRCSSKVLRIYEESCEKSQLKQFDGVIITGSSAMLDENRLWMKQSLELIQVALDISKPLLGVCFGHQLLGATCKALIGPHSNGRHQGSAKVIITQPDSLLPQCDSFYAQVSHRDVILTDSPLFKVLAKTEYDNFHVIKAGTSAWGVQFHPEWDINISKTYVEKRKDMLTESLGRERYEQFAMSLRPSDSASSIIDNFISLVVNRA